MQICPDCFACLDVSVGQCNVCGWQLKYIDSIPIYLSSKDSLNGMFKSYLDNYDQISLDDLNVSIQNEKYLHSQSEKFFSYLPDVTNLSVCEVGIGKGMLLDHLMRQKMKRFVGVDISLPYMKTVKGKYNQINVVVANAENIPFEREFDLIVAADIIEHVFNVGDFLFSVYRALKPGGKFVVKTPLNEDISCYSKLKGCPYEFVHLRNFNKKSLSVVLKGAGYKIDKIFYDGFYAYRKRKFLKESMIVGLCKQLLKKDCIEIYDVNLINNFVGRLFMKPMELTMVTTKLD